MEGTVPASMQALLVCAHRWEGPIQHCVWIIVHPHSAQAVQACGALVVRVHLWCDLVIPGAHTHWVVSRYLSIKEACNRGHIRWLWSKQCICVDLARCVHALMRIAIQPLLDTGCCCCYATSVLGTSQ